MQATTSKQDRLQSRKLPIGVIAIKHGSKMSLPFNIERIGEIEFTKPIHRALLRDGRLSWGARGLFAFLWDLPSGWRPCIAHLVKMGTQGTYAVTALRVELAKVKALEIVAVRHNSETAAAATAEAAALGTKKVFKDGQVVGSRWRLYSPTLWAIEKPLGNPDYDGAPTALLRTRNSVNLSLGDSHTKVHQVQGSPNTRHHPMAGIDNLDSSISVDWTEAIELEVELEAKKREIKNPPGLKRAIAARYKREGGPGRDIINLLSKHRETTRRVAESLAVKELADRQAVEITHTGQGPPDSSLLGRQLARMNAMRKSSMTDK